MFRCHVRLQKNIDRKEPNNSETEDRNVAARKNSEAGPQAPNAKPEPRKPKPRRKPRRRSLLMKLSIQASTL